MSCPIHGRILVNCSRECNDLFEGMTLSEWAAEEEMIQTAVAMSNSVLEETDEIQRREELDLQLAIVLSNSDSLQLGRRSSARASPQQTEPQRASPRPRGSAAQIWTARVSNHVLGDPAVRVIAIQLPGRTPSPAQTPEARTNLTYFGLHQIYWNYRYVPVKFSDEHQWPAAAVYNQLEELNIYRGNEDIVEWQEGQSENDRCLICLTNVATRIAVPCGHKMSCRACIARVVTTTKSNKRYLARIANGDFRAICYEIPVRCLLCRCIVGMIIVSH